MGAKVQAYKCSNCGAHLQIPKEDGHVTCAYCKAVSSVDVLEEVSPSEQRTTTSKAPTFVAIAVALVVAAVGLGQVMFSRSIAERVSPTSSTSATTSSSPPRMPVPPADPLVARLEAYVDCFNRVDHRLLQARQRYLSWVKDDDDFSPTRHVLGIYTVNDPKRCIDQAKPLADQKKLPALDEPLARYLSEVAVVHPLLQKVDVYYARKHYQDDDFAQGRVFHQQLRHHFSEYAAVRREVLSALDPLLERHYEQVTERDQANADLTFLVGAHTLSQHLAPLSWQSHEGLDLEAFGEQTRDLEVALEKLSNHSLRHGAERFVRACLALFRRIKSKQAWSRSERARLGNGMGVMTVEGAPEAALEAYNQLVRNAPLPLRQIVPASWRMRGTTAP